MALRNRFLVAGIAVLFLLMAPMGVAQKDGQTTGINNPYTSTPTTLYMHIDGIQDFPINTQPPDDRFWDDQKFGTASFSNSCMGDTPAGPAQTFHTYYGYSTPGYVEYDFVERGGPRYHPERGISFDVDIDTSAPMVVYWYMETQVTAADLQDPANPNNVAPFPIPNAVAKATMREGDAVGVGDAAFNEGDIIAQGETEPQMLLGDATPANDYVSYRTVDGKHVYEFAIPMEFQGSKIDRDESYNLRIDVFIDNPACDDPNAGDQYLMLNNVRVHTSPGQRPRAEFSIMNAIKIEFMHPQFIGDELVIHTAMNSPWGNYDVREDEGGIELSIDGPSPATSLVRAAFVQRHHDHNHHQEAVDVTYVWPYKKDNAKDGVYTVNMAVDNDQETATATGSVQFQIGKGGDEKLEPCDPDVPVSEQVNCAFSNQGGAETQESPGLGIALVAGLLGAAAFLRRRR